MTRKIAESETGLVYAAGQLGAGYFCKILAVRLIREKYSAIEEFQDNVSGEARLVADLIRTSIIQTYYPGRLVSTWNRAVRGPALQKFVSNRHPHSVPA
jgi:serine/threonine-protein kinase